MLPVLICAVLLIFSCSPRSTSSANTYTTRWDTIDIEKILKNDRILKKYMDCLMDRGKCTPDGQELKKVLPDALQTECMKCSDAQKEMAGKALAYILQYKRNYWNELLAKYDPDQKFRKKYEYQDDD